MKKIVTISIVITLILLLMTPVVGCKEKPSPQPTPTPTPEPAQAPAPAPEPAPSAEFKVSSLVITPTEVAAGEPVTVKADITNIGGSEGVYTVSLKVNGVDTETRDVVLDAGATKAASFTLVKDTAATYNLEIDGQTGVLRVLKPAEFELGSLIITPKAVVLGSPATVKAEITNIGEATGTYKATLKVKGVKVETKEVTLDGGETKTVSFDVTSDVPGPCDIQIDGLTGTLRVPGLKTYSSPRYGYSISHGGHWRLDTSDEAEVRMFFLRDWPVLTISAEVLEEELTLKEYYQADIEKGKSQTPSLKVISTKKVREAEALPGYEVDFTLTIDGAKCKGRVLYMVSGRLGFGVFIIDVEEEWDVLVTVYDAMLQSFVPPRPEFEPPPVTKLSEATMAKSVDPQTFAPVRTTDTFTKDAPAIYCVFKIQGVADTKVHSEWVLVKGDGLIDEKVATVSMKLKIDVKTPTWGHFYMVPPPEGWWVGDYKVTLYLKDREVVTLPFTVTR